MKSESRVVNRVLITGGSGFIGSALARSLLADGIHVRIASRVRNANLERLGAEWFPLPDLANPVDWIPVIDTMEAVVHLAGLAHRFETEQTGDWELYDAVNHQATKSLALAVKESLTVKRFLFMSTVRVHGNTKDFPINTNTPKKPITPYDKSKSDAEISTAQALQFSEISWTVFRPVMVYGPGNRGNMAKLEFIMRNNVPIPVGRVPNKKSFLYIDNLISAIKSYLLKPKVISGCFWLIADKEILSTEELLRTMSLPEAMNVPVRFIYLPNWILTWSAHIGDAFKRLGLPVPWNSEVKEKLLGDLYVDIETTMEELDWQPPFTLKEGISRTYSGINNEAPRFK